MKTPTQTETAAHSPLPDPAIVFHLAHGTAHHPEVLAKALDWLLAYVADYGAHQQDRRVGFARSVLAEYYVKGPNRLGLKATEAITTIARLTAALKSYIGATDPSELDYDGRAAYWECREVLNAQARAALAAEKQ